MITTPRIITVHSIVIHIPVGQEHPVRHRKVDVDAYAASRTHRSPSVISAPASPRHPCRSPFVAGNPGPSVIIIVIPASVMERSPPPRIVGDPGVSVVGHRPVPVRGVRMKIASCARNPNVSVIVVFNPRAVRIQIVVKRLKTDGTVVVIRLRICIVVIQRHAGRKHQRHRGDKECMFDRFHICIFLNVYPPICFAIMTQDDRKGLTFPKAKRRGFSGAEISTLCFFPIFPEPPGLN